MSTSELNEGSGQVVIPSAPPIDVDAATRVMERIRALAFNEGLVQGRREAFLEVQRLGEEASQTLPLLPRRGSANGDVPMSDLSRHRPTPASAEAELLSEVEMSRRLRMSDSFLSGHRARGTGPTPKKKAGRIAYDVAATLAWFNNPDRRQQHGGRKAKKRK